MPLLEKAMAPHSSTFAWKIPWTEEPGRLQSMGSQESDTTERLHFHFSLSTFMHWRWKWQPTPVFLPGESQGRGALLGCRLWGRRVGHDWSDLAAAAAAVPLLGLGIHRWAVTQPGQPKQLWNFSSAFLAGCYDVQLLGLFPLFHIGFSFSQKP